MNDDELRLECLRLASPGTGIVPTRPETEAILNRARDYADFVFLQHDAPVLRAAKELAKAVNQ